MSETLAYYADEAKQLPLPQQGLPTWWKAIREMGLQYCQVHGFPTRHDEDWKYTPFQTFLEKNFQHAQLHRSSTQKPYQSTGCADKHAGYLECAVVDGHVIGLEEIKLQLPDSVQVFPLAHLPQTYAVFLQQYSEQLTPSANAFHALNAALFSDGIFIYVPEGVRCDKPIVIKNRQRNHQQAVYLRHMVILEKNASLVLIEDYAGDADVTYFTNTITQIYLNARAKLIHYKTQRESMQACHFSDVLVRQQGESSEFASHVVSLGAQWARSDIRIDLLAENAQCLLNGIYLPNDQQYVDHHTVIHHKVSHCMSKQDYKGIVGGVAQAVFNGQVHVAHAAQKTQASQQNKNILLTPQATVNTKPQLEIFADDVVCAHGATVGFLDQDTLFYLVSRGLDAETAKRYLIQAFVANNLTMLDDKGMQDWVIKLIDQKLLTPSLES